MIKRTNTDQVAFDFNFTLCNHLSPNNRWVQLADMIPWKELGAIYEESLSVDQGAPSIPSRVVVGALIIKHMKNLSDEETVEDIRENPYYQYFLGYSSFQDRQVFTPSLFVEIRKRLGKEKLGRINEIFLVFTEEYLETEDPSDKESDDDTDNKGMLIMDATAAPQDIAYPTDVGLLNESREKLEKIMDVLWEPNPGGIKPRTYRQVAHEAYLSFSRKRKPKWKTIKKVIKKQLGYVRRNLKHIDILLENYQGRDISLSYRQLRQLWIIKELFHQQDIMFKTNTHSIPDRIVSISQPYIRPIVRGKAKAHTEFGAKISAIIIDRKIILDRLSWDAYNESEDLIPAVERYKDRFGYYPESVNADKIYHNRKNSKYLKSLCIDFYGGKQLGRPSKNKTLKEKKHHKQESVKRNRIEGVFGLGKRRYGLGLVMTKTKQTSESWIALVIFVMNVAAVYRDHVFSYFYHSIEHETGLFHSIIFHMAVKYIEKWKTGLKLKPTYQTLYSSHLQILAF